MFQSLWEFSHLELVTGGFRYHRCITDLAGLMSTQTLGKETEVALCSQVDDSYGLISFWNDIEHEGRGFWGWGHGQKERIIPACQAWSAWWLSVLQGRSHGFVTRALRNIGKLLESYKSHSYTNEYDIFRCNFSSNGKRVLPTISFFSDAF